ncbi:MAG TPA: Ldh family oxidoreductase [Chloroflexota bacterium]|jgi:LDH2 family malate/lactate/ureidoglycolate dehydrogenase
MPQVPAERLRKVATALFRAVGTPDDVTGTVVDILIESNLAGHDSHGVQLIPGYMKGAQEGRTVASARPTIVEETATTALVSGHWGWGQMTAAYGTEVAIRKARESKIAAVGLVECNHVGRLGEYSERAIRAGLALIATLGSAGRGGNTAPFGGRRGALGTNPWSMGLPAGGGRSVLLDFATTVVAGNKVAVARAKGEQLPPGAILDKDGNPATDPEALRGGGVMLPFGAHKGYALAVFAELFGNIVAPSFRYPGPGRGGGTFLIALDPAMFAPPAEYEAAAAEVLGRIKAVEPAPGFSEVLTPGEPEARSRQRRGAEGVPLPEPTWEALKKSGSELGVDVEAIT